MARHAARFAELLSQSYSMDDLYRDHGRPPCDVDQQPAEFKALLEIFTELRPRTVVEIGQYKGGSLFYWRALAPDATIVGVDINHKRLAAPSDAVLITGDSTSPTVVKLVQLFAPIDFLFIDGEHYGDTPRSDFLNYAPLVRPGGVVAVHDINWHKDQKYGIGDVWRELRGDNYDEFIALPPSMEYAYGIGVSYR